MRRSRSGSLAPSLPGAGLRPWNAPAGAVANQHCSNLAVSLKSVQAAFLWLPKYAYRLVIGPHIDPSPSRWTCSVRRSAFTHCECSLPQGLPCRGHCPHLCGLPGQDHARAACAGMHLVEDHVLQLLVVHWPHEDEGLQGLPGAATCQHVLPAVAEAVRNLRGARGPQDLLRKCFGITDMAQKPQSLLGPRP